VYRGSPRRGTPRRRRPHLAPPHHDIYSIEDIKQLIHDLRTPTEGADHVKLVSEVGVGTVAAGWPRRTPTWCCYLRPRRRHRGVPAVLAQARRHAWELGLAETQQTLIANKLATGSWCRPDGQLKTGRDVVIAALLGAEEFGFATAPLVVSGCI